MSGDLSPQRTRFKSPESEQLPSAVDAFGSPFSEHVMYMKYIAGMQGPLPLTPLPEWVVEGGVPPTNFNDELATSYSKISVVDSDIVQIPGPQLDQFDSPNTHKVIHDEVLLNCEKREFKNRLAIQKNQVCNIHEMRKWFEVVGRKVASEMGVETIMKRELQCRLAIDEEEMTHYQELSVTTSEPKSEGSVLDLNGEEQISNLSIPQDSVNCFYNPSNSSLAGVVISSTSSMNLQSEDVVLHKNLSKALCSAHDKNYYKLLHRELLSRLQLSFAFITFDQTRRRSHLNLLFITSVKEPVLRSIIIRHEHVAFANSVIDFSFRHELLSRLGISSMWNSGMQTIFLQCLAKVSEPLLRNRIFEEQLSSHTRVAANFILQTDSLGRHQIMKTYQRKLTKLCRLQLLTIAEPHSRNGLIEEEKISHFDNLLEFIVATERLSRFQISRSQKSDFAKSINSELISLVFEPISRKDVEQQCTASVFHILHLNAADVEFTLRDEIIQGQQREFSKLRAYGKGLQNVVATEREMQTRQLILRYQQLCETEDFARSEIRSKQVNDYREIKSVSWQNVLSLIQQIEFSKRQDIEGSQVNVFSTFQKTNETELMLLQSLESLLSNASFQIINNEEVERRTISHLEDEHFSDVFKSGKSDRMKIGKNSNYIISDSSLVEHQQEDNSICNVVSHSDDDIQSKIEMTPTNQPAMKAISQDSNLPETITTKKDHLSNQVVECEDLLSELRRQQSKTDGNPDDTKVQKQIVECETLLSDLRQADQKLLSDDQVSVSNNQSDPLSSINIYEDNKQSNSQTPRTMSIKKDLHQRITECEDLLLHLRKAEAEEQHSSKDNSKDIPSGELKSKSLRREELDTHIVDCEKLLSSLQKVEEDVGVIEAAITVSDIKSNLIENHDKVRVGITQAVEDFDTHPPATLQNEQRTTEQQIAACERLLSELQAVEQDSFVVEAAVSLQDIGDNISCHHNQLRNTVSEQIKILSKKNDQIHPIEDDLIMKAVATMRDIRDNMKHNHNLLRGDVGEAIIQFSQKPEEDIPLRSQSAEVQRNIDRLTTRLSTLSSSQVSDTLDHTESESIPSSPSESVEVHLRIQKLTSKLDALRTASTEDPVQLNIVNQVKYKSDPHIQQRVNDLTSKLNDLRAIERETYEIEGRQPSPATPDKPRATKQQVEDTHSGQVKSNEQTAVQQKISELTSKLNDLRAIERETYEIEGRQPSPATPDKPRATKQQVEDTHSGQVKSNEQTAVQQKISELTSKLNDLRAIERETYEIEGRQPSPATPDKPRATKQQVEDTHSGQVKSNEQTAVQQKISELTSKLNDLRAIERETYEIEGRQPSPATPDKPRATKQQVEDTHSGQVKSNEQTAVQQKISELTSKLNDLRAIERETYEIEGRQPSPATPDKPRATKQQVEDTHSGQVKSNEQTAVQQKISELTSKLNDLRAIERETYEIEGRQPSPATPDKPRATKQQVEDTHSGQVKSNEQTAVQQKISELTSKLNDLRAIERETYEIEGRQPSPATPDKPRATKQQVEDTHSGQVTRSKSNEQTAVQQKISELTSKLNDLRAIERETYEIEGRQPSPATPDKPRATKQQVEDTHSGQVKSNEQTAVQQKISELTSKLNDLRAIERETYEIEGRQPSPATPDKPRATKQQVEDTHSGQVTRSKSNEQTAVQQKISELTSKLNDLRAIERETYEIEGRQPSPATPDKPRATKQQVEDTHSGQVKSNEQTAVQQKISELTSKLNDLRAIERETYEIEGRQPSPATPDKPRATKQQVEDTHSGQVKSNEQTAVQQKISELTSKLNDLRAIERETYEIEGRQPSPATPDKPRATKQQVEDTHSGQVKSNEQTAVQQKISELTSKLNDLRAIERETYEIEGRQPSPATPDKSRATKQQVEDTHSGQVKSNEQTAVQQKISELTSKLNDLRAIERETYEIEGRQPSPATPDKPRATKQQVEDTHSGQVTRSKSNEQTAVQQKISELTSKLNDLRAIERETYEIEGRQPSPATPDKPRATKQQVEDTHSGQVKSNEQTAVQQKISELTSKLNDLRAIERETYEIEGRQPSPDTPDKPRATKQQVEDTHSGQVTHATTSDGVQQTVAELQKLLSELQPVQHSREIISPETVDQINSVKDYLLVARKDGKLDYEEAEKLEQEINELNDICEAGNSLKLAVMSEQDPQVRQQLEFEISRLVTKVNDILVTVTSGLGISSSEVPLHAITSKADFVETELGNQFREEELKTEMAEIQKAEMKKIPIRRPSDREEDLKKSSNLRNELSQNKLKINIEKIESELRHQRATSSSHQTDDYEHLAAALTELKQQMKQLEPEVRSTRSPIEGSLVVQLESTLSELRSRVLKTTSSSNETNDVHQLENTLSELKQQVLEHKLQTGISDDDMDYKQLENTIAELKTFISLSEVQKSESPQTELSLRGRQSDSQTERELSNSNNTDHIHINKLLSSLSQLQLLVDSRKHKTDESKSTRSPIEGSLVVQLESTLSELRSRVLKTTSSSDETNDVHQLENTLSELKQQVLEHKLQTGISDDDMDYKQLENTIAELKTFISLSEVQKSESPQTELSLRERQSDSQTERELSNNNNTDHIHINKLLSSLSQLQLLVDSRTHKTDESKSTRSPIEGSLVVQLESTLSELRSRVLKTTSSSNETNDVHQLENTLSELKQQVLEHKLQTGISDDDMDYKQLENTIAELNNQIQANIKDEVSPLKLESSHSYDNSQSDQLLKTIVSCEGRLAEMYLMENRTEKQNQELTECENILTTLKEAFSSQTSSVVSYEKRLSQLYSTPNRTEQHDSEIKDCELSLKLLRSGDKLNSKESSQELKVKNELLSKLTEQLKTISVGEPISSSVAPTHERKLSDPRSIKNYEKLTNTTRNRDQDSVSDCELQLSKLYSSPDRSSETTTEILDCENTLRTLRRSLHDSSLSELVTVDDIPVCEKVLAELYLVNDGSPEMFERIHSHEIKLKFLRQKDDSYNSVKEMIEFAELQENQKTTRETRETCDGSDSPIPPHEYLPSEEEGLLSTPHDSKLDYETEEELFESEDIPSDHSLYSSGDIRTPPSGPSEFPTSEHLGSTKSLSSLSPFRFEDEKPQQSFSPVASTLDSVVEQNTVSKKIKTPGQWTTPASPETTTPAESKPAADSSKKYISVPQESSPVGSSGSEQVTEPVGGYQNVTTSSIKTPLGDYENSNSPPRSHPPVESISSHPRQQSSPSNSITRQEKSSEGHSPRRIQTPLSTEPHHHPITEGSPQRVQTPITKQVLTQKEVQSAAGLSPELEPVSENSLNAHQVQQQQQQEPSKTSIKESSDDLQYKTPSLMLSGSPSEFISLPARDAEYFQKSESVNSSTKDNEVTPSGSLIVDTQLTTSTHSVIETQTDMNIVNDTPQVSEVKHPLTDAWLSQSTPSDNHNVDSNQLIVENNSPQVGSNQLVLSESERVSYLKEELHITKERLQNALDFSERQRRGASCLQEEYFEFRKQVSASQRITDSPDSDLDIPQQIVDNYIQERQSHQQENKISFTPADAGKEPDNLLLTPTQFPTPLSDPYPGGVPSPVVTSDGRTSSNTTSHQTRSTILQSRVWSTLRAEQRITSLGNEMLETSRAFTNSTPFLGSSDGKSSKVRSSIEAEKDLNQKSSPAGCYSPMYFPKDDGMIKKKHLGRSIQRIESEAHLRDTTLSPVEKIGLLSKQSTHHHHHHDESGLRSSSYLRRRSNLQNTSSDQLLSRSASDRKLSPFRSRTSIEYSPALQQPHTSLSENEIEESLLTLAKGHRVISNAKETLYRERQKESVIIHLESDVRRLSSSLLGVSSKVCFYLLEKINMIINHNNK